MHRFSLAYIGGFSHAQVVDGFHEFNNSRIYEYEDAKALAEWLNTRWILGDFDSAS